MVGRIRGKETEYLRVGYHPAGEGAGMTEPCPELRRRICPFISAGDCIVRCKGRGCNACRPVHLEDRTIWVCALIDRYFSDCWEAGDGILL